MFPKVQPTSGWRRPPVLPTALDPAPQTQATYDYLRSICPDVVVTQGDFDESGRWPGAAVVSIGGLKVGMCHGHQLAPWGDADVLAALQRRMDVDILVMGHTHEFAAYERDGRFVINPGSATGAYSVASPAAATPSFVLMDVDAGKATVYVYELAEGDEVKVDKLEYIKKTAVAS